MTHEYSHFLHRHNFAAWAAARAAQRGWIKTHRIVGALANSGLPDFLRDPANWPDDPAGFDALHRHWCGRIIQYLGSHGDAKATFGRAAKVIAVYLKCMVVVGPGWDSSFAQVIHPPIDRVLLQGIAKDRRLDGDIRSLCRKCNWTQLTEERYYELIAELRTRNMHQPAFWALERHWRPVRGAASDIRRFGQTDFSGIIARDKEGNIIDIE